MLTGVEFDCDPMVATFDPAILTHFMAKNCPKLLKKAILWPLVTLEAPNGWISVDQGWIRTGHIQGDVWGPFPGSGMAIGGRHRAPKWLKKAIIGPFVAISHPECL